jgi:hypothetical protein
MAEPKVWVFFYGSYINFGVLREVGLVTAEDFEEWYGQTGDWIHPGQSVTDPNNFGSPPVLWAYYYETEEGKRFLTGGIIE